MRIADLPIFKSLQNEITSSEARIANYHVVGGGLVQDKFGEAERAIELQREEEKLRESITPRVIDNNVQRQAYLAKRNC